MPPYLADWLDAATRDLRAQHSPFSGPLPLRPGMVWLLPRLVAIVDHEGDHDGALQDARFRALRFDGRSDDCRREEPVSVPHGPASGSTERPRLVVLNSLPFGLS